MGMLFGFAPWIVYWALVGNAPFGIAVSAALALAVAVFVVGRVTDAPGSVFEIGSIATFSVLTVVVFASGESPVQRWLLPLGNLGIFLVALVGPLIGKPFVHDFAAPEQPPDVVNTELLGRITGLLTWMWIAVFAAMTVSSAIPPIVHGRVGTQATILDRNTPLSFVCYWVIPFSLFGVAALVSRILPARMLAGINDVVRETSFVAYDEATIDELYYLAQEHANREVGAGKEAYDVRVGGMGTPLTGDESRKSWPSTYKVRERKH
ncbi:hypothetical protein [Mycobacterium lacus]|uniref:hypothetical protein n=1 Tax=Mycobacterium lacus TaxID=169765 RepID=UPI000A166BCC|nr:hypothetical protein [Mycobacterium lacus]MCV7123348.1 hypothetical protein [Mycobacterium lacus]ORW04114.1 hypothetical protein AWC15_03845 [Mycobacterium lacus]